MAITTSAPNGVIITTAAVSETATSQTQAGSNQIVLSDSFTNLNNGNTGTSTYVGRLVMIRRGTGTQEIKYCTAETAGTGTTYILTVHEDWSSPPVASTDQVDVSYIIQDAATVTGLTLVNKRVADYSSSRRFSVGDGTNFAFFAMVDGVSLESVDNSSTTVADFRVLNNAWFVNGYLASGTPVSGGYIIGTPANDGELVFDAQSGSNTYLYDWFLTCVKQNMVWLRGNVTMNKAKIFSGSYTSEINGASPARNLTFEGKAATTDTWLIDSDTDIDTMSLISTNGFITDADATVQTIDLYNITFVGNLKHFLIYEKKTINLIDPVSFNPTVTDQTDIDFAGTNRDGVLNEKYSLNTTIQQANGSAISTPRLFLYEGTQLQDLQLDLTGDANGIISSSWTYKNYVDNSDTSVTVTTYGNHAIRAYKYTYLPFIAAQTSNAKFSSPITLSPDSAITETTQATAISNGSGITVQFHKTGETDTRPMKVLYYDGGTGGTPTVGATVTSGSASGTIVEYIGDATSGTLVVDTWNGTEFTDNTTITDTGTFSATTDTAGFYQEYTVEVDCNSLAMTAVYDYLAARMAESTLQAIFQQVHDWGTDEQGQLIYSGSSGYYTERNVANTEGVWFSNRGTGTIAYMTSDGGTAYVPPVQYSFTLTGLKTDSEVRIYKTSDDSPVAGTESSGTSFSYNYTYSGDIGIYVIVFHLNYNPVRLTGQTLSNSNQSIPIQQITDRVYSNP